MFIVTKEIDSENISKLCRTCLREDGEKMVCLFVGPAGSSLAAKLRTLSCLEVWQGDGLPEKLCDRCVTRAESALLYREQCRAADTALRQAASKVSNEVNSSKLHHRHDGAFSPPVDSTDDSVKCLECGVLFATYRELCSHSQAHMGFVRRESRPVQHMNIVESRNTVVYTGGDSSLEKGAGVMEDSFVTAGIGNEIVSPTKSERAACALHCSLCNHTFTNRIQLMNHHCPTQRRNEDVESSGSRGHRQLVSDKMHNLGNSRFDQPLDQSYGPANVQAINYSAHGNLVDTQSIASEDSDLSSDACSDEIPRFPRFADLESRREYRESEVAVVAPEGQSTDEKKRPHKCGLCDKSFGQRSKLVAHNFRHTGEKPFKCIHCEKAYTSKSKLNAHTRLHTQIDVHRCNVCDKTFSYPSYLAEHAKVHDIEKRHRLGGETKEFECSICNKRFGVLKNFKVHMRLHTGKGVVRCEICHKTFGQKYNLKVHLRTHRNNEEASKYFKCNYCGKGFGARGNFVEHLRIHTKVKPFKCRICFKSFSQSSHLKTHETTHNPQRPHQCGLCGKRYKLAAHLRRHATIHNGTKPAYKCHLCEQIFSHEFSLKRHVKRHNDAQS